MNGPDSTLERLRLAFEALAEEARPGDDCPVSERLWDALTGALSPEETRALVAHSAACPVCAEAWRLGRDLAGSLAAAPAEPVRSRAWWGGLAAAAAVAVAAVSLAILRDGSAPPQDRAGVDPVIGSLVPEDRPLPRSRVVLRWTSAGADARYDVRVAGEDLVTLARVRGLAATEFVVPPEALSPVASGGRIWWQVEASLPDGRRLSSMTFMTRIE